jgi:hypothetical protein
MEALHGYTAAVHHVATTTTAVSGGEIAPTLYSVGIVICLALLLLWYGMIRRPG